MGWQDAPIVSAPSTSQEAPKAKWQDAPVVSAPADVPTGQPGWSTDQAPIYSPETSAGLGTTAVASLAEDPKLRMQYYSQQRGVPLDRYRVIQGRVAYQDKKGDWRYEESPNFLPHSMGEAGQQIASGVGGAIPAIAGGAVGIATAPAMLAGPLGLAGSMAATGAAGAAGEAGRQALAHKFVAPGDMNWGNVAAEGAQSALGQGIGAGLGALEQRYAVPDIKRLNTPAADEIEQKAAGMNPPIQLTPAESTNLASLKGQQKMLGNMPQTADDMASFYENRASNQIAPNVSRVLDSISPEQSAVAAGTKGRQAAMDAIEAAYKKRTQEVTPLYQQAVTEANKLPTQQVTAASTVLGANGKPLVPASKGPKEAIDKLLGDPFFKGQVSAVKGNPLYKMQSHDDTSLTVLDQVKKNLDDMIETAKRGGERNKVRLIEQRRAELLKATDSTFPEYPIARQAFEAKSPEVEAIANSVLGVVAKLKDTNVQKAAGVMFGPGSSPEQIGIAVREMGKRDPETLQSLKRSWLQMEWENAGKQGVSGESVNQGAKFRKALFGSEPQKARIKAALDPNEFAAMQDLADVLEATGRVKPIGSDTAWNDEMKKQARDKATPFWARAVGNFFTPQKWGELVKDWATEKNLKSHAADVTEIITNPDARKLLQELKVVSPQSMRFKVGVGHLLSNIPSAATGRTAPSREDQQ